MPQPVIAAGVPVCIEDRLDSLDAGSIENETGDASIDVTLRRNLYLGISLSLPCPLCVGDITANDGVAGGVCSGGARNGLACDTNTADTTFGDTSLDYPPTLASNLSGGGTKVAYEMTTVAASLPFGDLCDAPLGSFSCACGACSGDPSIACSDDATCASLSVGTCTNGGVIGAPRQPNSCADLTCTRAGAERGECSTAGPDDQYCDGYLDSQGRGLVACVVNADCDASDSQCPGFECGNCTLSETRPCFLDPIDSLGNPGVSEPRMAGVTCVAPTASAAVNSTFGLPGPERFSLPLRLNREP